MEIPSNDDRRRPSTAESDDEPRKRQCMPCDALASVASRAQCLLRADLAYLAQAAVADSSQPILLSSTPAGPTSPLKQRTKRRCQIHGDENTSWTGDAGAVRHAASLPRSHEDESDHRTIIPNSHIGTTPSPGNTPDMFPSRANAERIRILEGLETAQRGPRLVSRLRRAQGKERWEEELEPLQWPPRMGNDILTRAAAVGGEVCSVKTDMDEVDKVLPVDDEQGRKMLWGLAQRLELLEKQVWQLQDDARSVSAAQMAPHPDSDGDLPMRTAVPFTDPMEERHPIAIKEHQKQILAGFGLLLP